MPIYNWMGGREVSHRTAESYKEKVIEVMELDGYILTKNSSKISMTPDLIFYKPDTEGGTEIWVETKYQDLSISTVDFLTELARYFCNYMKRNYNELFDLYIFIRKCKNWNRWRKIFSIIRYQKEEALNVYNKMINKCKLDDDEKLTLNEFNFSDFEKFLADTYVHQVNYEGLLMKIEEYKSKSNDVVTNVFFTREFNPLRGRDILVGNFSEIKFYPEFLYISKLNNLDNNEKTLGIYPKYLPIWVSGDYIFSLIPLEDVFDEYSSYNLQNKIDFFYWSGISRENKYISQILLKKYVLKTGVDKGCKYTQYRGDILYFEHKNLNRKTQNIKRKQVSRCFRYAKPLFVKHEAVQVDVKYYGKKSYLVVSPIALFSYDGKNLIIGEDVRKLHDKFSPNKFDNNKSVFGDLNWWFKYIGTTLPKFGQKPLRTGNLMRLTLNHRPPKNSSERDNLIVLSKLGETYEF